MAEKIVLKVTKGIRAKVTKATVDWEIRDKQSNKVIAEGKKT